MLGSHLSNFDVHISFIRYAIFNGFTVFDQEYCVRQAVKYINNLVSLVFSLCLKEEEACHGVPQQVVQDEKKEYNSDTIENVLGLVNYFRTHATV